ncbi:MAG: PD-(D/E)XK nuclease family protein [Slackia sp.]|nr:PD-(D/E)XK nuclease family protein [Slackia sp.]
MRTVLFAHQDQALAFQKRHARDQAWSFEVAVSGVDTWVGNLWSLWGDGRARASKTQRMLAFLRVLEEHPELGLPKTFGMASLLVKLADEVLGSAEFENVLLCDGCADERRSSLVAAVRFYEAVLSQANLVDGGRACALLAAQSDIACQGEARVKGFHPTAAQKMLIESFFAGGVSYEDDAPVIARVADDVRVRFAFPSGRYAEPFLLARYLEKRVDVGRVLVTAKSPIDTYDSVAPALSRTGISCSVSARRPWLRSDFGRAYASVSSIVRSDAFDRASCTDFLLNPFSGVSSDAAYSFDASLRRDRLMGKESCLERIRALSCSFEHFEALVSSVAAEPSVDYFVDYARAHYADAASEAEQLDAIRVLREVMAAARAVGESEGAIAALLDHATVAVSKKNCTGGRADVHFVSAYGIGSVEERLWPTVVMCDMDNVSFPVRQADDAAWSFADELGIARPRQALSDLRYAFSQAANCASEELVIERCLNDASADPTYPCAAVEEFVDCYRVDPTDASEIDNPYALPPCFVESVLERGEESLYANASVQDGPQPLCAEVPRPCIDAIESDHAKSLIVLPRETADGIVSDPCFSASQIESYLECPQKWFALLRLRLDELDEGFGAVEMGDFSHGVFDDFYRRFQSEYGAKVTDAMLPQARVLMRRVIDERALRQRDMKPSSNRLVPASEFEQREFEELSERLVSYLDREAMLLPDFSPYAFEFEIPASNAVEYAGYRVMGKIDRIDVDERGRAVIIDYKSSLSDQYDLYEKKDKDDVIMRQGKVQTLVYAQAIRRLLGFDVVGALYVSYGRSPKASGAIDNSIEPAFIPGIRADRCVYRGEFGSDFSSLLDATEERIAKALDRLVSGRIEAAPTSSGACSYCPEISCRQRRG